MDTPQSINVVNRYPEFESREGIEGIIHFLRDGQLPHNANTEWKKRRYRKRFGQGSGFNIREGHKLFYGNREVVLPTIDSRRLALKAIYDDEKRGLGVGEREFFDQVCSQYVNIHKKQSDDFLKHQGDVRVATVPHRFPMSIRTNEPNERWGCDLIDMTMYPSTQNGNMKYIMTVVDYFSGKVWARGIPNRSNGLRQDEQRENDEHRQLPAHQAPADAEAEPEAEPHENNQEVPPQQQPQVPEPPAPLPARRARRGRVDADYVFERQRVRDISEIRTGEPRGKRRKRGGAEFEDTEIIGGVEHGRARQRNSMRTKIRWTNRRTAELRNENPAITDEEIRARLEEEWRARVDPQQVRARARAEREQNRVQRNPEEEQVRRNERTPNTLLSAFRSIIAEAGIEPRIIQVDNEFNQGGFKIFCTRRYKDVGRLRLIAVLSHQSFTNGRVERCNREIRKKTKAGFIRHNNLQWYGANGELLQTYIDNINSQKGSRNRRSPNEIWFSDEETPEDKVETNEAQKKFIDERRHNTKDHFRYEVGTKVRLNLLQYLPKMRKKRKSNFGWNQVAVHFSPEIFVINSARHYPENSAKQDEYTLKKRRDDGQYEVLMAKTRPRIFRGCDLMGVYHNSAPTHLEPPDYKRAQFINRIDNPNKI